MIDIIKKIPILDVATKLGIKHKKCNVECFTGHDNNTKSLSFKPSLNIFKCFGCGISGDNIELVKAYLKEDNFKVVLEWFSNNFDIDTDSEYQTVNDDYEFKKNRISDVNTINDLYCKIIDILEPALDDYMLKTRCLAEKVIIKNNIKKNNTELIYNLYKDRKGVTKQNCFYSMIGYILLEDFKINKDLITSYIEESGLKNIMYCDYFFPFYQQGKVYYIQGANGPEKSIKYPKYSYLKEIEKPLLYVPLSMQKKDSEIIKTKNSIYVTEGIVDSLSMLTMGINSVAVVDASMADNKIKLLEFEKIFNNKIVLIMDNDVPGEKIKFKLYEYLLSDYYNVSVKNIQDIAYFLDVKDYVKDANNLLQILVETGVQIG